jgi:hypothetical protein
MVLLTGDANEVRGPNLEFLLSNASASGSGRCAAAIYWKRSHHNASLDITAVTPYTRSSS